MNLKHSFCSNCVDCESFLESNSPDLLALCETNLDDSVDSGNFYMRGYHPLIQKDSTTHVHGPAVNVKEELPFAWGLSLENLWFLTYIFDWLYLTQFLLISPLSIMFFIFMHSFYSNSFNVDEVLSINPSPDVFFFGDFNTHHKDWLTYSGGIDRPGELCYNFFYLK